MVEMAVREGNRLKLKTFIAYERRKLRRLLSRIDTDHFSGFAACDHTGILLKGREDKSFDDHTWDSLSS